MNNSYYLLRHLSVQLEQELEGFSIGTCFSQNKDELLIGFYQGKREFYIKATLTPQFCCLSFPDNFDRARKNSVDLFEDINGKEVLGVRQFENERSFLVRLSDGFGLLFKMHGNMSNVLLIRQKEVLGIFKNNLRNDFQLNVDTLDRALIQTNEAFEASGNNTRAIFPTFGGVVNAYLKLQKYETLEPIDQWNLLNQVHHTLLEKHFYLIRFNDKLHLSLIRTGEIIEEHKNPIEALNGYFHQYIKVESLTNEKKALIAKLSKQVQQGERYLKKLDKKLMEISSGTSHSQRADIIMANLHSISKNATEVTLFNFYDDNQIVIKLKRGLNPQMNAENYYRKSKNQKLEINKLKENSEAKQRQIREWSSLIEEVNSVENFKKLKLFTKEVGITSDTKNPEEVKPYKAFIIEGFNVWVGKNAKANDELTLKHTHKDDLWLHAKDVSGSHVVIKHQSGKTIPASVLERAASLAAYYSKRKTDSLCPVSYTTKKYVRKPKGFPAGAVVVDREDVIIVEPKMLN